MYTKEKVRKNSDRYFTNITYAIEPAHRVDRLIRVMTVITYVRHIC